MTTITTRAEVDASRRLHLAVDCDMPPGPVDVVLMVLPAHAKEALPSLAWTQLWGLGRDAWQDTDVARYMADLREDREPRQ